MDKTTHWLPKRSAASRMRSGRITAAELTDTLSAPARSTWMEIVDTGDAAADRKGNVDSFSYGPDDVDEDIPLFMGRRNIVENELIGPLLRVKFPNFTGSSTSRIF